MNAINWLKSIVSKLFNMKTHERNRFKHKDKDTNINSRSS